MVEILIHLVRNEQTIDSGRRQEFFAEPLAIGKMQRRPERSVPVLSKTKVDYNLKEESKTPFEYGHDGVTLNLRPVLQRSHPELLLSDPLTRTWPVPSDLEAETRNQARDRSCFLYEAIHASTEEASRKWNMRP
jgi:hypothetical protein